MKYRPNRKTKRTRAKGTRAKGTRAKREGKLKCPMCKKGQLYYRKSSKDWKCWRCKKVM